MPSWTGRLAAAVLAAASVFGFGAGADASDGKPRLNSGPANVVNGAIGTAYGVPPAGYGSMVPGPDGFSGSTRPPLDNRNQDGGDRARRERGHEFEWRGEGWDRYGLRRRAEYRDPDERPNDWALGGDRD